jgi:PPOX class probable F420-dependent enzyme
MAIVWTAIACALFLIRDASAPPSERTSMSELSMSVTERQQFLAGVHVGLLAVEREGGPPLAAPVWYRYSPGDAVEFTTGRGSEKVRCLTSAGRASLCVQSETLPYAYVTVEGPVEITDSSVEARTEIAVRYLGEAMGKGYVESADDSDAVLVRLHPQRWRTTDYAKFGGAGA